MPGYIERSFRELCRVRPKTRIGEKGRIAAILRKVRFSKNVLEELGSEETLRDITGQKFYEALHFAKKIMEERKIYYHDRYYVDFLRVAEILGEAKRLDGPTLIAAVLQTLMRPRKAAADDPGYFEEIQPYLKQIREKFGGEVLDIICDALRLREINYIARSAPSEAYVTRGKTLPQTEDERAQGHIQIGAEIIGRNKPAAYLRLATRLYNLESNADLWTPEQLKAEINLNEKVYIPLASIHNAQYEKEWLADFNLKHTQPDVFEKITKEIDRAQDVAAHAAGKQDVKSEAGRRAAALREIKEQIIAALPKSLRDKCEIKFRVKSASSIHRGRQRKGANMDDGDIIGFRVIIDGMDENQACRDVYKALKKKFKCVPGRAKDFIGKPKPNGFRAFIDTFIFGTGRFEVQIVGKKMHDYNETNHETYKGNITEAAAREITQRTSTTVYTLGGETHTVSVGANAVTLAAQISTHLAFSINVKEATKSVTLRRADPFKPLRPDENHLIAVLQPGDSLEFHPDFVGSYQDYPEGTLIHDAANRQEIIAACNDNHYRHKLIEWSRKNPPRRAQQG